MNNDDNNAVYHEQIIARNKEGAIKARQKVLERRNLFRDVFRDNEKGERVLAELENICQLRYITALRGSEREQAYALGRANVLAEIQEILNYEEKE